MGFQLKELPAVRPGCSEIALEFAQALVAHGVIVKVNSSEDLGFGF